MLLTVRPKPRPDVAQHHSWEEATKRGKAVGNKIPSWLWTGKSSPTLRIRAQGSGLNCLCCLRGLPNCRYRHRGLTEHTASDAWQKLRVKAGQVHHADSVKSLPSCPMNKLSNRCVFQILDHFFSEPFPFSPCVPWSSLDVQDSNSLTNENTDAKPSPMHYSPAYRWQTSLIDAINFTRGRITISLLLMLSTIHVTSSLLYHTCSSGIRLRLTEYQIICFKTSLAGA